MLCSLATFTFTSAHFKGSRREAELVGCEQIPFTHHLLQLQPPLLLCLTDTFYTPNDIKTTMMRVRIVGQLF